MRALPTLRALGVSALLLTLACSTGGTTAASEPLPPPEISAVHGLSVALRTGHAFKNLDPAYKRASYYERLHSLIVGGTWLIPESRVAPLASVAPDLQALRDNGHDATVTWIGHSTLLVQLDGVNFLTDPIWNKRSGPFGGLVGVRRYTPPPLRLEDLPRIDFVLISHDHYDHLDEPTVRRLSERFNPTFVVPLGIKAWFADRGITNVVELGWGQSVTLKDLTIVCTPAQHGSGRTMVDQGRRLWASWAVLGSQRFYFAGDTGYASHFREIGDALGPFDLAALPIGSYTPREIAHPVHISPEEALQAWTDLRAKRFIGIHWGTFMLAREPYDEPPRRIAAEVSRRALDPSARWVSKPGETVPW
ncbi:MAG TPA: MBL fold metallo-hydrolase [Candidatus Acidoferrales bacterium]|nr:MBL fold metallo-hydrolase [Candidatus Acidoferrales bacterium]